MLPCIYKYCLGSKFTRFYWQRGRMDMYLGLSQFGHWTFWRGYRRKRPAHLFAENENASGHQVLEGLAEYRRTVAAGVQQPTAGEPFSISDKTITEYLSDMCANILGQEQLGVVQRFLRLTDIVRFTGLTVEDTRFVPLIKAIASEVTLCTFSDDQLESVISALRHWPMTESTKTPNFKFLWNSLDTECHKRASQWSTERLLKVADNWYHLRLSRIGRYNSSVIRLLSHDIMSLSPNNLIHLLFLINLQRDAIVPGIMDTVERALLECFEVLSMGEISVASMGFFKSRTRLKSPQLVNAIIAKVTSNLDGITDQTLLPVLKLLGFSSTPEYRYLYLDFQRRCLQVVDKFLPNTIMHLALISRPQSVCDETLLLKMVKQFLSHDFKSIRLKEFARCVLCLGLFLPEEPKCVEFVRRVMTEMENDYRLQELNYYPDSFVSLLFYASYMNIYPSKLIRLCFSPTFLNVIADNASLNVSRELYAFACGLQIECAQLAASIGLPDSWKERLFKEFEAGSYSNSVHDKCLQNVREHLIEILGSEEFVHVTNLLPHFIQKDVLIILDKTGIPKPIPNDVLRSPPGTIIKRNGLAKWVCIVIEGRGSTPGKFLFKKRQLQALGHSVIHIPWIFYTRMTSFEQRKFLEKSLLR